MMLKIEPHPKTQIPSDTHPEIEKRMIEGLRKMTASEKLRAISDMGKTMKQLALAEVKRRHPEASEEECMLRVLSRSLPEEMMLNVFGWDVKVKGY